MHTKGCVQHEVRSRRSSIDVATVCLPTELLCCTATGRKDSCVPHACARSKSLSPADVVFWLAPAQSGSGFRTLSVLSTTALPKCSLSGSISFYFFAARSVRIKLIQSTSAQQAAAAAAQAVHWSSIINHRSYTTQQSTSSRRAEPGSSIEPPSVQGRPSSCKLAA